ncbi:MAG TPA: hypothetical protein VJI68_00655 [Candidatus Nanoarchaeia archaeon]|nr:hypothetical protein [Candidatus Nanoarchaeia archaeon]
MNKEEIIKNCKTLLEAYKYGKLGQTRMPEDSNPGFSNNEKELRLVYFTLPMSLNYQRDSYKLWEAVLKTYNDEKSKSVFNIENSAKINSNNLREILTKYKIALQPNKHINTWQTISKTVFDRYGTITKMLEAVDNDYLKLKKIIQEDNKKGFPYLSGPKIFNYWCFILKEYCKVDLKNSQFIEIAPDTHVTKCSVLLNVISETESLTMTKEKISERWREILIDSGINPIDMHPPLWFWSRNDFKFKL